MLQAASLLESNPDCLLYVVGRSLANDDLVVVSEVWTSSEAHKASLQNEEVRALIQRAMPLIAEMPPGTEYAPLGGKGLPPPA